MTSIRNLALGFLVMASAGPALADGALPGLLSAQDRTRLERLDVLRGTALSEARARAAPADLAALDQALSGALLPVRNVDLTGAWRCRTLKMGRSAGLVVYGWFRCRIVDDGAGWRLDKLTGSQRVSGRFYDDGETRMIFAGALSLGDEPRRAYGQPDARSLVALAVRPGRDRLRLEFPEPPFDSAFDVMELERAAPARR